MTEKTEHTPGPWSYRPAKHDDWGFVRTQPLPGEVIGHLVAVAKDSSIPFEFHEIHRENGNDPFEANGRVIAAAPEMLEALKHVTASLVAITSIVIRAEDQKNNLVWRSLQTPCFPKCFAIMMPPPRKPALLSQRQRSVNDPAASPPRHRTNTSRV